MAAPDLTAHLNQRLGEGSNTGNYYASVITRLLYWRDSDVGFHEEARKLGQFFRHVLGYDVEEFAIPSTQSFLKLNAFIIECLCTVNDLVAKNNSSVLLILYYGGHGDADDDRHHGEEERSVWAAQSSGVAKLKWYDIQPILSESEADVLLILDCCNAAQAARSSLRLPATIELLAAAAKGVRTPLPGPISFTTALLKEMQYAISESGSTTISSLYTRLCAREAKLLETPIHVKLKSGSRERSIKLQPMPAHSNTLAIPSNGLSSAINLRISLREPLRLHDLDEIAEWLKTDLPRTVAKLKFSDVIEETGQIQHAVIDVQQGVSTMSRSVSESAQADILNAWQDVAQLIASYVAQHSRNVDRFVDLNVLASQAEIFLRELKAQNVRFQERVARRVLGASAVIDENYLDMASCDHTTDAFGLSDSINLRRIIKFGTDNLLHSYQGTSPESIDRSIPTFDEYKYYEPSESLENIEMASQRVAMLADLLGESKESGFRSLRCLGWTHDSSNHRFIFQFEIPSRYLPRPSQWTTLFECIRSMRGSARPTLGERFRMAYGLAKALEKWHAIDWVHQGITGRNTVFFKYDSGRVDYGEPYMQGFDFARPNVSPSNGRYVDDVETNVYRHPDRQGLCRHGHRKIHDIYAMGVVLLEIGLWVDALDIVKKRDLTVQSMRETLISAATERLGLYAGKAYQAATIACLTGSLAVAIDDAHESHLAKAFQTIVVDELLPCLQIY